MTLTRRILFEIAILSVYTIFEAEEMALVINKKLAEPDKAIEAWWSALKTLPGLNIKR